MVHMQKQLEERKRFSIASEGHLVDVFGAVRHGVANFDIGLRRYHPTSAYQFQPTDFPVGETITGRMIALLRTSKDPNKAIKDYCGYRWAWLHNKDTPAPNLNIFKNPFSMNAPNGAIRIPRITVRLAIAVLDPSPTPKRPGHQVFAFSELAGTGTAIDIVEAMHSNSAYVTPGLYLAPKAAYVNPLGGCSNLWREETSDATHRTYPVHYNENHEWEAINPMHPDGFGKPS